MTTRQTPDAVREAVAVIQADRDAAFSYWCYTRSIAPDNNRAVEWRCKLNHGDFDNREIVQAFARHRLAALDSRAVDAGEGFVYWNPDNGEEYAPNHPVRSGECVEAERIRPSTPQEDTLWQAFQEQFARAEALSATPAPAVDAQAVGTIESGRSAAMDRLERHLDEHYYAGARDDLREVSAPAVDAVPAGMKAWHGGDGAPEDWNGEAVRLRNGSTMFPSKVSLTYHANGTNRWNHNRENRNPDWDIVAYTPKGTAVDAAPAGEEMNDADIIKFANQFYDPDDCGYGADTRKWIKAVRAALSHGEGRK